MERDDSIIVSADEQQDVRDRQAINIAKVWNLKGLEEASVLGDGKLAPLSYPGADDLCPP
jgi:hypothetical protein